MSLLARAYLPYGEESVSHWPAAAFTHPVYFVTGTDTDCGKTHVTAQCLRALKAQGKRVLGLKLLACGSDSTESGLRNTDALTLQAASSPGWTYAQINPYCFERPVSPHVMMDKEKPAVRVNDLIAAFQQLPLADVDHVFVEGVGGVLCPINWQETVLDWIKVMGVPVIAVMGIKLGGLNLSRMTWQILREKQSAPVYPVLNQVDPQMQALAENVAYLQGVLKEPQ